MFRIKLTLLSLILMTALAGCVDSSRVKPTPENARRALILRGIEYSEPSFLETAAAGDVWGVNAFLAAGINPNVRNEKGETILITASAKGDVAMVRALINGGADINLGDVLDGHTALMHALIKQRDEVTQLLLDRNPHLNIQSRFGMTALMIAVYRSPQFVPAMLEKGADINLMDKDGETALVRAVINNRTEIAKDLLAMGANPNVQNRLGATPLNFASALGNTDLVRALLDKGANPTLKDEKGRTAQSIAAERKYTEIVSILREAEVKKKEKANG